MRSLSYTAIEEEVGDGRGQYSLYVGCEEGDYSHLARGTSLKQIMDLVRFIISTVAYIGSMETGAFLVCNLAMFLRN